MAVGEICVTISIHAVLVKAGGLVAGVCYGCFTGTPGTLSGAKPMQL